MNIDKCKRCLKKDIQLPKIIFNFAEFHDIQIYSELIKVINCIFSPKSTFRSAKIYRIYWSENNAIKTSKTPFYSWNVIINELRQTNDVVTLAQVFYKIFNCKFCLNITHSHLSNKTSYRLVTTN